MKKKYLKPLAASILLLSMNLTQITAFAEEVKTNQLGAGNVTIENNVGMADTINVSGVTEGAIIKIYKDAAGGAAIATTKVAAGKTEAKLSVPQLGVGAGRVFVTLTNPRCSESNRTECSYTAEAKTNQLGAGNVTIENNVGIADTIYISGDIIEGTIIKVYKDATGGSAIATTTVAAGKTEAKLSIPQLGVGAGRVFITLTKTNPKCLESDRTECSYAAEVKTYQLGAGNVTIENNVGMADTINVSGVTEGAIIKIYKDAAGGAAIATTKVAAGKTEAKLSVPQLGVGAGRVFVTLTNPRCSESDRTECSYAAEAKTNQLGAGNVTIENNVGIADIIYISGDIIEGTIIKVYKDATGGSAIATTTVAAGKTEAKLSIPQLGVGAGRVFITLTKTNPKCLESDRTECSYAAEVKTYQLGAGNVTIENNVGIADIINVSGVTEGAIIKIYKYAAGGVAIATTKVAAGKTEAKLSVPQLGVGAGRVFVTLTNPRCSESDRTECSYAAEAKTNQLGAGNVTIENNVGIADTIYISGDIIEGTIIKVYKDATGGSAIATTTVAAGKTEAKLSIPQLGVGAGRVFITLTKTNPRCLESDRTECSYSAEVVTN